MTLKITIPLLALLAGIASVKPNDPLFADDVTNAEQALIDQHTWPRNGQSWPEDRALWTDLQDVKNIDAVEAAFRKEFAGQSKQSFSRDWWYWDRLRCRYVDEGSRDRVALHVLRAVFRGWILDWHSKLEAKGEGDLFYIFYTTTPGDKTAKVADDGRTLVRDVHGGGYHGGWGGASRMRIYEELVRNDILTAGEKSHFQQIVHQSLGKRFLNFEERSQTADNHAFGNAGGVALAIKLFPDAPRADAARGWLDRIWADLAEFGYREWNYHPYGPIFLHGMLDVAEATGKLETDRELIESLGRRCLAFIHGGGVRGNPNAASDATFPVGTNRQAAIYVDPWNTGYYRSEKSARDGHFWYRLAKQFEDPEFLWAAEQVTLGGRPPKR